MIDISDTKLHFYGIIVCNRPEGNLMLTYLKEDGQEQPEIRGRSRYYVDDKAHDSDDTKRHFRGKPHDPSITEFTEENFLDDVKSFEDSGAFGSVEAVWIDMRGGDIAIIDKIALLPSMNVKKITEEEAKERGLI